MESTPLKNVYIYALGLAETKVMVVVLFGGTFL
jgi:hypothetical protein